MEDIQSSASMYQIQSRMSTSVPDVSNPKQISFKVGRESEKTMLKQHSPEFRNTIRSLWELGAPTILEEALQTIVQYADTAMVGQIGAAASAAVGLTITIGWMINGPFFAMGMGVLAFISKSLGAGQTENARRASAQAAWMVLVLGAVVGVIALAVSSPLPKWMGADPEIRSAASQYFAIVASPMIFRSASIIFAIVLRASGNSKTPMLVNLLMNAVNIILNLFLIGPSVTYTVAGVTLTRWGADLGVAGAAIATAIAYVLGGTLMFVAIMHSPILTLKGSPVRPDKQILSACIRVGLPLMAERFTVNFGQVVFTSLVARLGTIATAAHSIALTAEEALYVPGYGIQAAVSTLCGNALGRDKTEDLRLTCKAGMAIATPIMSALALILFLLPRMVIGFFTADGNVITLGAQMLQIVAVSEPVFSVFIVLEGVFHGIGDTKVPFLYASSCMWIVRVLMTFLFVQLLHYGLAAAWLCMVADNVIRCILLTLRFWQGKWLTYFSESAQEAERERRSVKVT